ncbi:MAG: hypothetical protein AAF335_03735 [Bacteroidota bacterium]
MECAYYPSVPPTYAPVFIQEEAETLAPKENKDESEENFYKEFSYSEKGWFLGGIIGGTFIIVGVIVTWWYVKNAKLNESVVDYRQPQ